MKKRKEPKHSKHCQEQRNHFSPSVLSGNSILIKEALVVLADLSRLMAAKMEELILHVHGWINGHIAVAVVRSYSCMIRGDNIPRPLWYKDPNWGSGSGLVLAQ